MHLYFEQSWVSPDASALRYGVTDILLPECEVGDRIYFFDHREIREAEVRLINGNEITLIDDQGYIYLTCPWRYDEILGSVLISKGSMANKALNGFKRTHKVFAKSSEPATPPAKTPRVFVRGFDGGMYMSSRRHALDRMFK